MIAKAQRTFEKCRFRTGDAQELPFGDGEFDAVVCNFGVFHLADPPTAFREAFRVLKVGGRYAFSQWCAPQESPFFASIFGALMKQVDMGLAPAGPAAFEMSNRQRCIELMMSAGFGDPWTTDIDLVLDAPTDDFVGFFREFAVRGTIVLDSQPEEVVKKAEAAIRGAVEPFKTDTGYRIPMPAFVCAGERST